MRMRDSDNNTPQYAMQKLLVGNKIYLRSNRNPADISEERRETTTRNGQEPYAVILTCSDSRVVPEHIFSAGIGDLFVVRTAGNVVGNFEIGSIEYGVDVLGASLIVVLGHSHCGAVAAALTGKPFPGYVEDVVREIQLGLDGARDESTAIYNNILHSKKRVMQSGIIRALVKQGKVDIACAKYDIGTGVVKFFRCE